MIRSLIVHMWLLLTFRHDGRGLPVTSPLALVALLLGFLLGAAVRHHDAMSVPFILISGTAMMMIIAACISIRVAAGCMLISIAVDSLHAISGLYGDAPLWTVYECACQIAFFIRLALANKAGSS